MAAFSCTAAARASRKKPPRTCRTLANGRAVAWRPPPFCFTRHPSARGPSVPTACLEMGLDANGTYVVHAEMAFQGDPWLRELVSRCQGARRLDSHNLGSNSYCAPLCIELNLAQQFLKHGMGRRGTIPQQVSLSLKITSGRALFRRLTSGHRPN